MRCVRGHLTKTSRRCVLSNFVLVDWALKIKLLITFPTPTPSSCSLLIYLPCCWCLFGFIFCFILTALYIKIAHRVHCNLIAKLHINIHALMRKINWCDHSCSYLAPMQPYWLTGRKTQLFLLNRAHARSNSS